MRFVEKRALIQRKDRGARNKKRMNWTLGRTHGPIALIKSFKFFWLRQYLAEPTERRKLDWRGGETLAIMTVELNLERMEKMKQEVLQVIDRMVEEYGSVSVIELEMALIEGLAKVRELGMKKTEDKDEDVI